LGEIPAHGVPYPYEEILSLREAGYKEEAERIGNVYFYFLGGDGFG
jgi:hypothetical protein